MVDGLWAPGGAGAATDPAMFLVFEAVVDVALVTLLGRRPGGPTRAFPALYILVTSSYALPSFGRGIPVALMAALFYFADVYWGHPVRPGLGFWGQVVIILGSYGVVALLASRLRQAGAERESLQTELRRARLEAADILQNIRSGVLTIDGSGRLGLSQSNGRALASAHGARMTGHPILGHPEAPLSRDVGGDGISDTLVTVGKVSRSEGTVEHYDGAGVPIPPTAGNPHISLTRMALVPGDRDLSSCIDLKRIQELNLRAERLEAAAGRRHASLRSG